MKITTEEAHSQCTNILKPVRDSLDVLNGKWKLPIIVSLTFGEKRFTDITKDVNGLVVRKIQDTYPVKVTYALTPHSKSLKTVIDSLRNWGILHRKKLNLDCKERKVVNKK